MDYTNKNILVLGAGTSGIGAAITASAVGGRVILNDNKEIALSSKDGQELSRAGVRVITGRQDNSLLDGTDIIIVSPGIPLTIPILVEAAKRQIPIIGEVELAYQVAKAPILAVTGTNGKTTTTMLLGAVLKEAGYPICIGGNIGDSLSEQVMTVPANGYVVAEVSSYQLETCHTFHPKGAIVLNITPDHLQRHKTMAAYQKAKETIFANQTGSDFTVLNVDDTIVATMQERTQGHVLLISQKQKVSDGAYFADNTCYAVRQGQAEAVITTADIHLPGQHNIENILAVIALTFALGVPVALIKKAIAAFKSVEHRIEYVATIKQVKYYNDSKATNTDSAIKALEAFNGQVFLIAGGHDKMTPLADFMKEVKKRTKGIILIGEAAERFEKAAKEAGVDRIWRAESMHGAVVLGSELARAGDVVLLSPACSSFDWYSCFEERGDDFKKEVKELEAKVKGGR